MLYIVLINSPTVHFLWINLSRVYILSNEKMSSQLVMPHRLNNIKIIIKLLSKYKKPTSIKI